MQQWEKERREKKYKERINNVKAQVPVSNKRKSSKGINDSHFSVNSSLSGLTNKEKEDKNSIPLYKLLKMYNLQQYAQHLISRGFGYDLVRFAQQTENDINQLANEIKVLPGHKVKLLSLTKYIQEMIKISEPMNQSKSLFQATSYTRKTMKSKPKSTQSTRLTRPQTCQQNAQQSRQKLQKCKFTNIGCDFFQDESAIDDEFNVALNQILEKYKNEPYVEKPTKTVQSNMTTITNTKINLAKDDIGIINQFKGDEMVTIVRENKLLKNLEQKLKTKKRNKLIDEESDDIPDLQMSQIKHMYLSYETGKLTSTLVNLDIEEMSNCLAWCVLKHIQFHKKFNTSIMKNSSIPLSMEYKFRATGMNQNQDTSQNPIEEPTQLNFEQQQQQIGLFQSQQMTKLERTNISKQNQTLAQISEKTLDNTQKQYENEFDCKRQQIQDILKESLLFKGQQEQKSQLDEEEDAYSQDEQDYEQEYEQQEEEEEQEDYSPIKPMCIKQQQQVKMNNISMDSLQQGEDHDPIYNYSSSLAHQDQQQQSLFQSKFDFVELDDSDKEIKQLYYKTFLDQQSDQIIPSAEVISNYSKNIIITSKMEKEVTILCLIYIERLLTESGLTLEPQTWRRVLLISLIIASKIWDDESFENDNFAKVFPQYRTSEINEMERVFLTLIDYRLFIKQGDYAKYYFILRTFVEAKKKSFPLRPLDLNTIMKLQKNSNQAEYGMRQKYQQGLNKSF